MEIKKIEKSDLVLFPRLHGARCRIEACGARGLQG